VDSGGVASPLPDGVSLLPASSSSLPPYLYKMVSFLTFLTAFAHTFEPPSPVERDLVFALTQRLSPLPLDAQPVRAVTWTTRFPQIF